MLFSIIFIPLLNTLLLYRFQPYMYKTLIQNMLGEWIWITWASVLINTHVNPLFKQTKIKVYLSFWLIIANWMIAYLMIGMWNVVEFYMIEIVNLRLDGLSCLMLLVVVLVSSCVVLTSIEYLSILDSAYFLTLLSLFQCVMFCFVVSNDIIFTIINWDLLGLISYLLINFWASKSKSGIKAVVYNQVGDLSFLVIIAFLYSILPMVSYSPFLSFNLIKIILFYPLSSITLVIFSFSLIFIYYSKSAMLPLSSWLLNAMAAPTPVSSLLHSSTMVIAGVYLSLIMNSIIMLLMDSFILVSVIFFIIPIYTLIWSVFKAISLSDIKSIIAFSTVSQISYMFIATYLALSLIPLFHIVVHALFKSLLFLLSGSLIHVQTNYQSIYKQKINHSFISIIFILAGSVLVISLSKEYIIYSTSLIISSFFITIILILGGVFTSLYTLKIYSCICYR